MSDDQQSILKILVELVDRVTEPLRSINEDFEEFSESAHGWWTGAAEIFAGYESIEKLVEPAAAMAEVQTRLGLAGKFSAEQLQAFKEQAEELSSNFPKNAESIVDAQTELYKTLGNIGQTREAAEVATKLATVLGVDAPQAAQVLAAAYENLGDRSKPVVENMQEIADKLTVLTDLYPTSGAGAARMAMQMSRLGEVAKTYGIGTNQVFAVLAELNKLHVGGQRGAGMVVQELLQSLGELDKNGTPTLARYGLVLEKDRQGNLHFIATLERMARMQPAALQALLQRFHGQGQAISLALAHLPEIEEAYRRFEGAAGATNEAADRLANTPEAKIERLKDSVANLADMIGTQTLPQIIHIVDVLNKWVTAIDGFLDRHAAVAKGFGDIAIGIASLLTAAGVMKFVDITGNILKLGGELIGLPTILNMVGTAWSAVTLVATEGIGSIGIALTAMVESNPVGWILTVLGLLAFAGYEVYRHWDKVREVIGDVKAAVVDLFGFLAHSTLLDKLRFFADLGQGNLAAAGLDVALAQPSAIGGTDARTTQHLEYKPQVTVIAGPGTDANATADAVHDALQGHANEFWEASAAEQRRQENRRTFQDTTNPLFAR